MYLAHGHAILFWDMAADEKGIKGNGRGKEKETADMAVWWRECVKRRCMRMKDGKVFWGKERERRMRLREDAVLHGWVAGSQVNMTYEYCRSHSLPSCPPQLLMSGSKLAQLLRQTIVSTTPEHKWENTEENGQKDTNNRKKQPTRKGGKHYPVCRGMQNEMRSSSVHFQSKHRQVWFVPLAIAITSVLITTCCRNAVIDCYNHL